MLLARQVLGSCAGERKEMLLFPCLKIPVPPQSNTWGLPPDLRDAKRFTVMSAHGGKLHEGELPMPMSRAARVARDHRTGRSVHPSPALKRREKANPFGRSR